MASRYILRCPGCGAPLADSLKRCPHCEKPTTFEALGMHGGLRKEGSGRLVIEGGAKLVVGVTESGEQRECPFCGGMAEAAGKFCGHCGSKIVLETLWMRSLTIGPGGSMVVGKGGSVRIGRPPEEPALADAARRGDLAAIKAALDGGAELDGCGDDRRTALHHAILSRQIEAARYLVAMGASLDDKDAEGRNAAALAKSVGLDALVPALD